MHNRRCGAILPAVSTVALSVPLLVRSVALSEARTLALDAPLLQLVAALRVAMAAVRRRLLTLADGGTTLVVFVFCHAVRGGKKQAVSARKRAASAVRFSTRRSPGDARRRRS